MGGTAGTSLGRVRGIERDGVRTWRGIPYAAPPVGALRFRPPQPMAAWDGVRDATRFAPTAMQSDAFRLDQQVNIPEPRSSEDCLYLNVWAPAEPRGPQPVMVWIHGGGFVEGAGSDDHYDGSRLVRNGDVVVVTLNYRLGPFGFLYLAGLAPDYADASNLGLRDQIAALRWVRDNIGAFGGDPDNVSVFGESAGGISIAALMAMPAARGLFRRAIIQSGGTYGHAADAASEIAREFLAELGVSDVRRLRSLPAPDIQAASERYLARVAAPLSLHVGPVVDGKSLPRHPLEAIRSGSARGIALIAGSNRDEGDLFYPAETPPSSAAYKTSRALFSPSRPGPPVSRDHLRRLLDRAFGPARAAEVIGQYPVTREGMARAMTDAFRAHALRLVEAQRPHAPVWLYRFDWSSPMQELFRGAVHALEVPFAWNTLDAPFGQAFTGGAPDAQPLADLVHRAWIAFARTGDPNTPRLPTWPAYQADAPQTMVFDTDPSLQRES